MPDTMETFTRIPAQAGRRTTTEAGTTCKSQPRLRHRATTSNIPQAVIQTTRRPSKRPRATPTTQRTNRRRKATTSSVLREKAGLGQAAELPISSSNPNYSSAQQKAQSNPNYAANQQKAQSYNEQRSSGESGSKPSGGSSYGDLNQEAQNRQRGAQQSQRFSQYQHSGGSGGGGGWGGGGGGRRR